MKKVKLVAAGDVLLHSRVYNKCLKKDGTYDFTDKMGHAKGLLEEGDITIVNLESIVAGTEFGLSSFPNFNNPIEIAQTLKEYGTDIVSIANNHTFDHGEEGLLKSIENLKRINLPYVGAYLSKKDCNTIRIIEKNGVNVAFLSYTKIMGNLKKIKKENSHLINLLDEYNVLSAKREIRELAATKQADIIVVSIHFGKEYLLYPTALQREIAAELSDAGADVILGHHPHVLQPPEVILNSKGKETFYIPSLGNFYTGQHGVYRQIGATLSIEIEKKADNSTVSFINPMLNLTFVDSYEQKDFKMYSFVEYIRNHPFIVTRHGTFSSLEIYAELVQRMRSRMPNLIIE